jgi:hypothetical protein
MVLFELSRIFTSVVHRENSTEAKPDLTTLYKIVVPAVNDVQEQSK